MGGLESSTPGANPCELRLDVWRNHRVFGNAVYQPRKGTPSLSMPRFYAWQRRRPTFGNVDPHQKPHGHRRMQQVRLRLKHVRCLFSAERRRYQAFRADRVSLQPPTISFLTITRRFCRPRHSTSTVTPFHSRHRRHRVFQFVAERPSIKVERSSKPRYWSRRKSPRNCSPPGSS
jgi:hypothetical protein